MFSKLKNIISFFLLFLMTLFTISTASAYLVDADIITTSMTVSDVVTATFNGNGGSDGGTIERFTGNTLGKLPTSERSGYTFVEWNTKADGTGEIVTEETVMPDGAVTYYAIWENSQAYEYIIQYVSSSGEEIGRTTVANVLGTEATVTPEVIAGYKTPEAKTVVWDSTDVKNITFIYEPIIYTISYDLEGGAVTVENPESYHVTTETFTLNNPTRTGYTFAGWTGSNGTTASKSVSVTKGTIGNLNYTANWTANTYRIAYNKNGGSGTMLSSTHTYDVEKALTKNTFTRTGYTFAGWNTESDGSGTSYEDGSYVKNLTATASGTITLYAQWVATFAVYSSDDTSLRFYKGTVPSVGDTYNGLTVTAVYTGIETNTYTSSSVPWKYYRSTITNVVVEDIITPVSVAKWFYYFSNCSDFEVEKLDVSNTDDFSYLFYYAGKNTTTFNIRGLSSWDVSNGTTFAYMFYYAGYNAASFDLDLSAWDVSNSTTFSNMFYKAGCYATSVKLNLTGWNVSNANICINMFANMGYGSSTETVELKLSGLNFDKISSFAGMFSSTGLYAPTVKLDLSGWNVSSGTDFSQMFQLVGNRSTTFVLKGLASWNVSNGTDFSQMFESVAGANKEISTFEFDDLSGWNVCSGTDFGSMFSGTGQYADYYMDLSGWDVSNATAYNRFNYNVASKIIAPAFGN